MGLSQIGAGASYVLNEVAIFIVKSMFANLRECKWVVTPVCESSGLALLLPFIPMLGCCTHCIFPFF